MLPRYYAIKLTKMKIPPNTFSEGIYLYIMHINLGKVALNISIRKDFLEVARQYIPCLSDFVEKKFIKHIYSTDPNLGLEWARPDSNRGPSPRQGDVITPRPRAPIKLRG